MSTGALACMGLNSTELTELNEMVSSRVPEHGLSSGVRGKHRGRNMRVQADLGVLTGNLAERAVYIPPGCL